MTTTTQDKQVSHSLLKRYIPILTWLPRYNRAWLRPDLIAGLTVVALLVPEGMAYAELAGLPPQTIFYAAPAGLILYAIFGTSRQLVVAVSATIAVMSAANDNAGAKTAMALIIAALGTALVGLFFTPLFRNLPEATLGAIVVVAVSGMMRVGEMKRLYRLRKADFALAMIALFGVLLFDVLAGLLIAVIISLLVMVARASAPKFSVLGRAPGKLDLSDVRRHPKNRTVPGLLAIRPNEGLFFANAASLSDAIVDLARSSDPPARAVLLDLEMTFELDAPSADALAELKEALERADIALLVSRVHGEVKDMLDLSGVTDKIGPENFHHYIMEGVFAYLREAEDVAEYARAMAANAQDLIELVDLAQEQAEGEDKIRLQKTRDRLQAAREAVESDQ